jgi:hypothetical protein
MIMSDFFSYEPFDFLLVVHQAIVINQQKEKRDRP